MLPPKPRRFPPPWTVEELDACFVVRDHNGQALAYVYFEDVPGWRSAAKLPAMKRGRSQPTSPSCRSYSVRIDGEHAEGELRSSPHTAYQLI